MKIRIWSPKFLHTSRKFQIWSTLRWRYWRSNNLFNQLYLWMVNRLGYLRRTWRAAQGYHWVWQVYNRITQQKNRWNGEEIHRKRICGTFNFLELLLIIRSFISGRSQYFRSLNRRRRSTLWRKPAKNSKTNWITSNSWDSTRRWSRVPCRRNYKKQLF